MCNKPLVNKTKAMNFLCFELIIRLPAQKLQKANEVNISPLTRKYYFAGESVDLCFSRERIFTHIVSAVKDVLTLSWPAEAAMYDWWWRLLVLVLGVTLGDVIVARHCVLKLYCSTLHYSDFITVFLWLIAFCHSLCRLDKHGVASLC